MPGWLQTFADVNPLTHLVGAERALLLGEPDGLAPVVDVRLDGRACSAMFVPLALRAYRKRI